MMKDITKVLSVHHLMSNPLPLALAVVNQEKKDTGIRQTHRVIPGLETQFILPDRKSTRLNSSHSQQSRMPSSA